MAALHCSQKHKNPQGVLRVAAVRLLRQLHFTTCAVSTSSSHWYARICVKPRICSRVSAPIAAAPLLIRRGVNCSSSTLRVNSLQSRSRKSVIIFGRLVYVEEEKLCIMSGNEDLSAVGGFEPATTVLPHRNMDCMSVAASGVFYGRLLS